MEKRALVLALALTLPLGLYGIPYAYATTTSTTYRVFTSNTINPGGVFTVTALCHSGDYATGGSASQPFGVTITGSAPHGDSPPNGWDGYFYNPESGPVTVTTFVVCQTPITVAGIGVPQFGSLYVAIALGAVAYFMLSRRFARRSTISAQVDT
jgi:hypothetical protein